MQVHTGCQLNDEEDGTKKTSVEKVAKNEKSPVMHEQVQDSLGNNLLKCADENQPEQVYDNLGNNLLN